MVWRKVFRGKESDSIINNVKVDENKEEKLEDFSKTGDVNKRLEKEMKTVTERTVRINKTAEVISNNDLRALHYDRLSIHIYENEVDAVLKRAQKMIEEKKR